MGIDIKMEIVYRNVDVKMTVDSDDLKTHKFKSLLDNVIETMKYIGDKFEIPKKFKALGDKSEV